MLCYLDEWLILASSRSEALQARDKVLDLCQSLGIFINLEKSCLVPSQAATYLGMVLASPSLRSFPHTEASVNLTRSNCRIFLLQEAKRCLLVMSSGSASLPLSPCSRRSSANAVPLTLVEGPVGFRRRVSDVVLDSGDRVRHHLVVKRSLSVGGRLPYPRPTRSAVLVTHIGSGLGNESPLPLCLRPLVSRRAGSVDHAQRVAGHSARSAAFQSSSDG